MPHVIAWCGFLGAWLLVAGPLDQAVREIDEQEFRPESLEEAKEQVAEPEPISKWWLLLPPVWWYLRRRREGNYRRQIGEAMEPGDRLALLTIKDILNAWLYVAVGAALIGIKETWELHEAYEWPESVFCALVVLMVVLCVGATTIRARHRQARPTVEA
ncbi:MAG TPA: hypothetical protein VN671_09120 [Solirubrobacterales bacterium]|nr:hypothetical protein [Solirubrobacterales bacterium]